MAAFNRPTNATYETHENLTVDTMDNEDHTFCGIMFPVKCKDLLPIDHLVIKSVAVRGRLGPLTVWVSNNEDTIANSNVINGSNVHAATTSISAARRRQSSSRHRRSSSSRHVGNTTVRVERTGNRTEYQISLHPSAWTKLYDKTHGPSRREYQELVLDEPIRLKPGETRVIYIHSTLPGDEAIVYDNSYYGGSMKRYEDNKIAIMTGRAHVSTHVFGQDPIWGWGNAWRDRREFVGRLSYGTVYKLWNPEVQPKFGSAFQDGVRALLLCQRHWESPVSLLPDECVYYVLNMCRWDWFNDDSDSMKKRRKREKAREKLALEIQGQQEQESASATITNNTMNDENMEESKPSASEGVPCRRVTRSQTRTAGLPMSLEDGGSEDSDIEFDMEDDTMDEDVEEEERDEEEEEEEEEEEDDDNSDNWSDDEDQYHTADRHQFSFQEFDSDIENDQNEGQRESAGSARSDWIRRQFARIHVLRALASMEDQAVAIID